MLSDTLIKRIPKVELHDHLDGGLRPETIIDLARQHNVSLPSFDPQELAEFFSRGSRQKNLSYYLESFAVTTSVMQTAAALQRVAFEAVEDLAADNVVYAEIRFAPILHTQEGLSMEEVVTAVLTGLEAGRKQTGMEYGLIISAMRNQSPELSLAAAKLAVAFRDRGVVGFDLAGDESGNPPKKHLEAFQYIRNQNFHITIHAGEGFGLESIWQAIQVCGAHRIGHGTRLVEDMSLNGTKIEEMGSLAHFIRNRRIPIEMCLSSNVGTGAATDYSTHPFHTFFRNTFRVFLSVDNRLMSATNLTKEMKLASEHYGLTLRDLEKITVNAMKSAFIHHDEKIRIIFDVVKKGYADVRLEFGLTD